MSIKTMLKSPNILSQHPMRAFMEDITQKVLHGSHIVMFLIIF